MEILLFGANGVMGTAIERVCGETSTTCTALGHDEVDVAVQSAIVEAIGTYAPTIVINAVALIGYDICEQNPAEAFRINALPASFIARACEERGITFVQLSTHAVFDGRKEEPYTEEDLPNPLNCYAATKYLGELFCRNLCSRHYVVRLPTLFGQRRNARPGFVDKVLERISRREGLRIADDKIDSPTYSLDAAAGLIELLKGQFPYGNYHLANSGSVSYFEFVNAIVKLLDSSATVEPVKDRDFPFVGLKPLRTAMASCRLPPLRSWQDALQDYLRNEVTR